MRPAHKQTIEPVLRDSYLAVIKNAVGSRMFRTFIARVDGRTEDILRHGELGCAFFVSSILTMFRFLRRPRTTVRSTVAALLKTGWRRIPTPRPGAVLVWEKQNGHWHIGFSVGNQRAVSTSSRRGVVVLHHWTFSGKRKLETVYWHPKLNQRKNNGSEPFG